MIVKVRKVARIKNRYNQAPHPVKDTTWESEKNNYILFDLILYVPSTFFSKTGTGLPRFIVEL